MNHGSNRRSLPGNLSTIEQPGLLRAATFLFAVLVLLIFLQAAQSEAGHLQPEQNLQGELSFAALQTQEAAAPASTQQAQSRHSDTGGKSAWTSSDKVTNLVQQQLQLQQQLESEQGLCRAFSMPDLSCVAIVGNGPLDDTQRRSIHQCQLIVRFNLLNNFLPGERLDIWVTRYGAPAKFKYWGFSQMEHNEAATILSAAKGIWLVGGNEGDRWILSQEFPQIWDRTPVLMEHESLEALYRAQFNLSQGAPSTGFVAIQAALFCAGRHVTVHIYGMNWSPEGWDGHRVDVEESWVRAHAAENRIIVHSPSCTKLRSCDTVQPGMDSQHPDCRLLPDGSLHCPTRSAQAANAERAKQMQQQWRQEQERQVRAGAGSRIVGRSKLRRQNRIMRRTNLRRTNFKGKMKFHAQGM